MTDQQLFISICVPTFAVLVNLLVNLRWFSSIDSRLGGLENCLSSVEGKLADHRVETAKALGEISAQMARLESQPH